MNKSSKPTTRFTSMFSTPVPRALRFDHEKMKELERYVNDAGYTPFHSSTGRYSSTYMTETGDLAELDLITGWPHHFDPEIDANQQVAGPLPVTPLMDHNSCYLCPHRVCDYKTFEAIETWIHHQWNSHGLRHTMIAEQKVEKDPVLVKKSRKAIKKTPATKVIGRKIQKKHLPTRRPHGIRHAATKKKEAEKSPLSDENDSLPVEKSLAPIKKSLTRIKKANLASTKSRLATKKGKRITQVMEHKIQKKPLPTRRSARTQNRQGKDNGEGPSNAPVGKKR